MNCKPGDLAVIVSADRNKENIGAIVRVIRALSGEWDWLVECLSGAKLTLRDGSGVLQAKAGQIAGAMDRNLRPIRPQSDDATDESTAWLPPVPQTEHV